MKKLLILFFLFISSYTSLADCAGGGLSFWPSGKTIAQNAHIMISGYAKSQQVVAGVGKKYPAYLVSGNKKIKLRVKEIHTGEFLLTQAILVPEEKLMPGKQYRLQVDGLPAHEGKVGKWNYKRSEYETVCWTVANESDAEAPLWIMAPFESKKSYTPFGCGPAQYVHFSGLVKESSDYLVKATVVSVKTKNSTTYYLEPGKEDLVLLGHGMCSGAFAFREKEYTVSFDLMDASGNTTVWKGEAIKFTRPEPDPLPVNK